MSISMKNHENRITALENKIESVGGIIESKLANPGYIKFSNGFIINFGITPRVWSEKSTVQNYAKPMSTFLSGSVAVNRNGRITDNLSAYLYHTSNTSCTITQDASGKADSDDPVSWMAIGYLISNRIKSIFRGWF